MNVSPKTYKRLFDAICKAIVKKIDPNSEMKFTQKDIGNATETIKGKIVNICSHYLHSPFKYFVDGKTHANKGNSFTMQDYRLVKAIEFVNEVPEEEKYIGENWGDEAGRQLKKFEEKFPMNELNLQMNNSELEDVFFKILSEQRTITKPTKIISIIKEYFQLVNDRKFLDAWNMLSPTLQTDNFWKGNFFLFEETFNFFEKVHVNPVYTYPFTFQFQKIKCRFGFAFSFNLLTSGSLAEFDYHFQSYQEFEQSSSNLRFTIKPKNVDEGSLEKLSPKLENCLFQTLFLTLLGHEFLSYINNFDRSTRIKKVVIIDVRIVLIFFRERWLIDEMHFSDYTAGPDILTALKY